MFHPFVAFASPFWNLRSGPHCIAAAPHKVVQSFVAGWTSWNCWPQSVNWWDGCNLVGRIWKCSLKMPMNKLWRGRYHCHIAKHLTMGQKRKHCTVCCGRQEVHPSSVVYAACTALWWTSKQWVSCYRSAQSQRESFTSGKTYPVTL